MDTHTHADSNKPRRRNENASHALIKALGVDFAGLDARTLAVMSAFSEEIMALREQAAGLRHQVSRAESLADRDTLCPLFNRRAFERELGREIALAERFETPLSVVYLDLDHFKQVNDRFGHQTGDDVLLKISDILKENTRETDIIGRLGGDEFGVALTHASYEDSLVKAEDLAGRISNVIVREADHDANVAPDHIVRLGASCGVAEWHRGMPAEILLAEADEAMFAIKALRHSPEE